MAGIGRRERLVAYGDPLAHALLAAAVVAPLARRAGSAPLLTAGGPLHAWAAFAGLASHLLRDVGDSNAPTPLLWPFAPARQLGRGPALAGIAALAAGSWLLSRAGGAAASRCVAGADDGAAGALRRTA